MEKLLSVIFVGALAIFAVWFIINLIPVVIAIIVNSIAYVAILFVIAIVVMFIGSLIDKNKY